MKLLEDRIRRDGTIEQGDVLKVDSFLNHQMDVKLYQEMGREWYRLFREDNVTKILTIEASGIGIACVAALEFDVPVIFAKKSKTKNIAGEVYSTTVTSFTHGNVNTVIVSKKFLNPGDRVLIIDDFLANGAAMLGLIDLVAPGRSHPGGLRHRRGKGLPARRTAAAGDGDPGGIPGPGIQAGGWRGGICRLNPIRNTSRGCCTICNSPGFSLSVLIIRKNS